MEKIRLNNGVEMPLIGFGTFRSADACADSVACAIRSGYRMLDTAQIYRNEAEVGEGIRRSGMDRKELFLTTKVDFRCFGEGTTAHSVEESMKALGTDYLDLVLLHWPMGDTYAAWRDLEKLYHAGVIRAIGVSNFDAARLTDFILFNEVCPAVDQIEVHLFNQRRQDREWLRHYNVACQAFMPLGRGRGPEMFEAPAVKAAAEKYGKTPAQIALKFLVQKGVSIIPKSVHEDRIRQNIDLFDFELTEEELTAMEPMDRGIYFAGTAADPSRVLELQKL